MESTLPHVISPSEGALGDETGTTPFAQQTVVLTKQAYIELKGQAHYWRAQYEQLMEREAALKAEIEAYQATIRDLTQCLYGTKAKKRRVSRRLAHPSPRAPVSVDNSPAGRGMAAGPVPHSPSSTKSVT